MTMLSLGRSIRVRARKPSAHRLLVATILVVPLALILGTLAGFAIGRIAAPPLSYRGHRLDEIAAELRRVEGDYLLAAGDSHVARWPAHVFCGLPLVNAGVEGATARDIDELLADLALPRPPRAIILTVGTNDANRKRFRDPPQAVIRFREAFRPLLRRLSRSPGLVVVTGLPAIDGRQAAGFSAEAAAAISASAEALCRASASCRVGGNFSADDALADGLHLADYDRAYARLAPALCRELAGQRAPLPEASQNAHAGGP
jgi:lysophospholipase L1-like esterase